MRALAIGILAFGLAVSPAIARSPGTGDDKDSTSKKADTSKDAPANTPATPAKTEAPAKPAPASIDSEIQQLRELLEAQTKQLQLQNQALKEQKQEMEIMRENLKAVNAPLENEGAVAVSNAPADPMGNAVGHFGASPDNPDAFEIRYKGITLKPGGFLAAEGVWRQGAETATVNSDFKTIPMPGASQAKLSDLEITGRQSQINLMVEGKADTVRFRGYVEADFLSAGVTSNDNESNSYTLRQRQAWGQAATDSGWEFTGGQMWSLVTETAKGTEPGTEVRPRTIDAQYNVGFSWARQGEFRVSKSLVDNKLTVAVSVENGETTFTGHGFAITNTTNIPAGTTGNAVLLTTATSIGNTLIGNVGDTGGLQDNQANYSYNSTPDFVVKAALDPGWGHYEIFGVVGTAKTRLFPCATASVDAPCINGTTSPSAFGATNDTRTIGGIGLNAHAPLFNKHLDAGFHFLGGSGVGRYGTSTIQDVTIRPDGTLAAIKSYQALASLEWHATPKLDIYAYVGGEYGGRTAYVNEAGGGVGYGSPLANNSGCRTETLPNSANSTVTAVNFTGGLGPLTKTGLSPTAYNGALPGALSNCTADTRNILEGTLGFWYRFYNGPKGRLQSGVQYSYAVRNTWSGAENSEGIGGPAGRQNMVFTSFRYYLP